MLACTSSLTIARGQPDAKSSKISQLFFASARGAKAMTVTMMRRLVWVAAMLLLLAAPSTVMGDTEEDEKRRSIRLKTTGQLKKIFAELEINYQESMTKQQLQELAYETDAVEKWLDVHPEKRRKKSPPQMYGEKPEGMDQAQWERIMQQMHGQKQANFDHIKDPEKRAILQKLAASGLQIPGSEDMDIEKLRNLGKILDDIPNMQAGGAGAFQGGGGGGTKDDVEEEVHEL